MEKNETQLRAEPLVLLETHGRAGILRLNREDVLNALSPEMLDSICSGFEEMDADDEIRVMILTGSERVFAAGADIKVMAEASGMDMLRLDTISYWRRMRAIRKPVIAAVSGYAFGGGCELAMQCDMIVASETARFAQSEIVVGIMPGAGGTQRLARAVGPYRAMEMVLTGAPMGAREAFGYGLVNRLAPVERYLDEALDLADLIATKPPAAVRLAKEAVRHGIDTTLREGMKVERRNFYMSFETEDHREGMRAFLEKRPPEFKGK